MKQKNIKVVYKSRSIGGSYTQVPKIQMEGRWLKELGFDAGTYISVSCENVKLVITPDVERAALEEAEAAFMEKETKILQKKFEEEKKRLHAQFVAERKAGYGVVAEPGLEV